MSITSFDSPEKCVVLVPVGAQIEPACEAALVELAQRGYAVRRVYGYAAIDQARNEMAAQALADGYEETLWIDSDISFEAAAVDRLRSHDFPIVCGVYARKRMRALACHVLPGTSRLVFGAEGGLSELLYAGAGFLLVRRQVYFEMQEHLALLACNQRFGAKTIPFFQPMVISDSAGPSTSSGWYLPEDYAFCERARQCGFAIMADTTIRLWHHGSYGYSWEDAGKDKERYETFYFNVA
ncbi:MAG: hypothetical protein WD894_16050 [Pirellulales bacterium]